MQFAILSALSLAALALAQGTTVIDVGDSSTAPGGVYQFLPPSLTVANGTTVTFRFTGAPGNHSVTQSTFTDPCNPAPGGFDSGWVFIPGGNVITAPEWNLTITDSSTPLWFFCKQLSPVPHCSAGMVGAINAPAHGDNLETFENYVSNAKDFVGPSGQGEGSLVGHGAYASTGPGPSVDGVQFFGTPLASNISSSSGRTSETQGGVNTMSTSIQTETPGPQPAGRFDPAKNMGAIIGGSIGGFILLALLAATAVLCRRRKNRQADVVPFVSQPAQIRTAQGMRQLPSEITFDASGAQVAQQPVPNAGLDSHDITSIRQEIAQLRQFFIQLVSQRREHGAWEAGSEAPPLYASEASERSTL